MLLGFKTELKLNNQQRTAFAKHCGVARHAWNWGLGLTKQILDHNKLNPDSKIKFRFIFHEPWMDNPTTMSTRKTRDLDVFLRLN